jgi:hypothetical protein
MRALRTRNDVLSGICAVFAKLRLEAQQGPQRVRHVLSNRQASLAPTLALSIACGRRKLL